MFGWIEKLGQTEINFPLTVNQGWLECKINYTFILQHFIFSIHSHTHALQIQSKER